MTEAWRNRLGTEERLLLVCARIELGDAHREEAHELIGGELDWQRLVRLAVRHGIPNLVFHHLRGLGAETTVPAALWQQLERHHAIVRLLAMRQRYEATRIIDAFSEADIRVMALKGIMLREALYPDPGMRASGDIDLMVQVDDRQRAAGCLSALGYSPASESHCLAQRTPDCFHHMSPFHSPTGAVMVEVHWHLTPHLLHVDPSELWRRATTGTIEGREVALLSPEDQFLHLCVHAAQTTFRTGLRHPIDVAELGRARPIAEGELVARAAAWRIDRHVSTTAHLVNDLIGGSSLCRSLMKLDGWDLPPGIVATLRTEVLGISEHTEPDRDGGLAQAASILQGCRWGELLWRFFPSRAYMERAYRLDPGSPLVVLLYALRPFLLLARYGPAFLHPAVRRRLRASLWLRGISDE